jgi:hypothetical protein
MSEDAASNYLRDPGDLLKQAALRAREDSRRSGQSNDQFALGRLSAFHEVVSLMQQQASAFDLDLRSLSLEDVDPDRDLL